MGLRKTLNEKPVITTTVALLIVVGSLIWLTMGAMPKERDQTPRQYYTVDDGNTWFADSMHKVPPFEHQGQEAVIARVFQAEGGEPFVAYLERFTPEAKKAFEAVSPAERPDVWERMGSGVMLVKRPGAAKWIPIGTPEASMIRAAKGPAGESVKPVLP